MRRNLFLFLVFLIVIGPLQCSRESNSPADSDISNDRPKHELTQAERKLAQSANSFGFSLFHETNSENLNGNLFISPLSISFALGMAYNGAAGSTREAIQNTLKLGDGTPSEVNDSYKNLIQFLGNLDPNVDFEIANSVWYRLGFPIKNEFIETNQNYFDARVAGLDFDDASAAKAINDWVAEKTRDKIDHIIDSPIDPLTMFFLINAIYFKGVWLNEFDTSLTYDGVFGLPDGSNMDCRMMHQENNFYYFGTEEFQAIDLPYGDSVFSMTIFLPKPQININDFVDQFTEDSYHLWLTSLESKYVKMSMPKFRLECNLTLNNILSTLGMGIAFTEAADFSNIADMTLYISLVKHKTFVEVDEKGTEAAAVTAITGSTTSINPNDIYMVIDHPFIFVIRENNSNTILFMGKIIEPIAL